MRKGPAPAPLDERIRRMSTQDANGCWLWQGISSNGGYGLIRITRPGVKTRTANAHRVAYEAFVGPIPEGMVIDHLCRVRRCVNPEHLEAVTQGENLRRGYQARRAS